MPVRVQYAWRDGSRVPIDAQAAGQRLATIHKRKGHLSAELVVNDAKSQRSPLHPAFEWDDPTAAHEHRLEQARNMLRSVVMLRDNGEDKRPIRAFVHVEAFDEPVYMDINVAMGDEALRKHILARAWRELESWRQRYEELEELAAVFAAIDKAA